MVQERLEIDVDSLSDLKSFNITVTLGTTIL